MRSTVERGIAEEQWLNQNGDWIQILVIQHYLFFGNSQSLLNYITTMFEDVPPSTPEEERTEDACNVSPLPPKPKYIVLDFAMVSGMDTSAVDIIREIIDLCQTDHCKLFVAGLKPSIKASLMYAGIKPSFVARKRSWVYANDMEAALAKAEDELLSSVFHLEEKVEIESNLRHEHWLQEEVNDGFSYALQKLDERHGLNTCQDLKGFQPFTYSIDLKPGGVLVRDPTTNNHGLYFVETGLMKVQWSQANTIARLPYSTMDVVQDSIGHLDARSRTMGREAAMLKESMREHPNVTEQGFRLARIGQGWIIGGIELANGMNRPGVHIAISTCRLHHLPYSAIQMAERENPLLAMSLYKILSHLAIKRQEMTIEHLGQHLHILHSPVPRLRGGKKAMAELQNPLGNYSHLD